MRFEKINEDKLKIELSKEDLLEHNLKLTDIAIGTDDSRKVLHKIMEQAFLELDFEPESAPLMIEAVPTSAFSINIVISKMRDREEFEAKLNNFGQEGKNKLADLDLIERLASEIELHSHSSSTSQKPKNKSKDSQNKNKEKSILERTKMIYKFDALDDVIFVSHVLGSVYSGASTLYKHDGNYYLYLHAKGYDKNQIIKLRLTLDEFGDFLSTHIVAQAFLKEHGQTMIKNNVFSKLSQIQNV